MTTTATRNHLTTHVLTRSNKAKGNRHEAARFTPDGNLVYIAFETTVGKGRKARPMVYRKLTLDREAARFCWRRLHNQGWRTFREIIPDNGPTYRGDSNYAGD